MTVSFEQWKEELWDGDARSTAIAIMRALKVNKAAIETLLHVVTNGVTQCQRNSVRTVEYQAASEGGVTSAHGRNLLMEHGFYVGDEDRTYVTWGQATVEQHEMRVSYQLKKRAGLDVDIERHKQAIKKILACGVTCLDEIEDAA